MSIANFSGLTALITGASSGIGEAMAYELAQKGTHLVLLARRADRLDALAEQLRKQYAIKVHVCVLDLFSDGAISKLDAYIKENQLSVDVLVNNAGYGAYGEYLQSNQLDIDGQVSLNITALNRLTFYILPTMKAKGRGYLLFVASTASFQPIPGMALYAATKSFVRALGEGLHFELQPLGIHVTTLCPGPTRTEFVAKAGLKPSKKILDNTFMTAQDVAKEGITGLLENKRVVIPGRINRVGAFMGQHAPTVVTAKFAGMAFKM